MNTKKLIAAVAVFAATSSVFAAEVNEGVWPAFTSTRTRAEVVAELQAAQTDGSYAVLRQEYQGQFASAPTQLASTKTRAEVVAELKASKADGSYAALHQEYDGQIPGDSTQYARAGHNKNAIAHNGANGMQAN